MEEVENITSQETDQQSNGEQQERDVRENTKRENNIREDVNARNNNIIPPDEKPEIFNKLKKRKKLENGEDLEDDEEEEEEDTNNFVVETKLDPDSFKINTYSPSRKKRTGRRKISIEFIDDKPRRQITFSKRKAGLMKKAYELTTLTGTQALLLIASETGHVYTFATPKLQPFVTLPEGKTLIHNCLNSQLQNVEIEKPDENEESEEVENTENTESSVTYKIKPQAPPGMGRISAAQRHNFSETVQGNLSASLNFNVTKNVTKQHLNQQREHEKQQQRTTKTEPQDVNRRVPPILAFEYLAKQQQLHPQQSYSQQQQQLSQSQQHMQQINQETEPYNFSVPRAGSGSMRLPALPMNLKPPIRSVPGNTPIPPYGMPYPGDFSGNSYPPSPGWPQNYNDLLAINRYAPSISSPSNPVTTTLSPAITKPTQMMINQTNMDNLDQWNAQRYGNKM